MNFLVQSNYYKHVQNIAENFGFIPAEVPAAYAVKAV